MKVPQYLQWLIAATLLCGLLSITYISHKASSSRVLISVSAVEKAQQLDNKISERLADAELAKWDKLESEIFPDDSPKKAFSPKNSVQSVKISSSTSGHVSQEQRKPHHESSTAKFFS
jgi:hypothetical protein